MLGPDGRCSAHGGVLLSIQQLVQDLMSYDQAHIMSDWRTKAYKQVASRLQAGALPSALRLAKHTPGPHMHCTRPCLNDHRAARFRGPCLILQAPHVPHKLHTCLSHEAMRCPGQQNAVWKHRALLIRAVRALFSITTSSPVSSHGRHIR